MVLQKEQEVKHIADIVGEWGKWQLQLFVYCFLWSAVAAFTNMGYSFHAKSVDFWCSDVPQQYLTINVRSYCFIVYMFSHLDYFIDFNGSLPQNITNELKCNKYSDPQEVCTEWTYNTTQYRKSIFTEVNFLISI